VKCKVLRATSLWTRDDDLSPGHRNCPKYLRLTKHIDITIHWKGLEEHFLMEPLVFWFNHFQGEKLIFGIFIKKTSVLKELTWVCFDQSISSANRQPDLTFYEVQVLICRLALWKSLSTAESVFVDIAGVWYSDHSKSETFSISIECFAFVTTIYYNTLNQYIVHGCNISIAWNWLCGGTEIIVSWYTLFPGCSPYQEISQETRLFRVIPPFPFWKIVISQLGFWRAFPVTDLSNSNDIHTKNHTQSVTTQ
jgi:hypothetical protein